MRISQSRFMNIINLILNMKLAFVFLNFLLLPFLLQAHRRVELEVEDDVIIEDPTPTRRPVPTMKSRTQSHTMESKFGNLLFLFILYRISIIMGCKGHSGCH